MNCRYLCLVPGLTALLFAAQGQLASNSVAAQSPAGKQTWTVPRTPEGLPDFQGVWVNNMATPLERPEALAGRATLTDTEVTAMKKKAHELFSGQGDAAFGDSVFDAAFANVNGVRSGFKSIDGETGDYSSVWTVERDWESRTSLITDPADGRMPPMTPEGRRRAPKTGRCRSAVSRMVHRVWWPDTRVPTRSYKHGIRWSSRWR